MNMYGFEAIAYHNGWAISFIGIMIVFTGLLTLSMVIRLFPKIIAMIEGNGEPKPEKKQTPKKTPSKKLALDSNIKEAVRQYRYLISWMGEPFSLPRLIELSEKRGLSRPYYTVSQLLHANIIKPDGKGLFFWHAE